MAGIDMRGSSPAPKGPFGGFSGLGSAAGSASPGGALAALIRAHQTTTRAIVAAHATAFKPVEPGVTGKERQFQQNRNFGPGPILPYPGSSSSRPVPGPHVLPNAAAQRRQPRAT